MNIDIHPPVGGKQGRCLALAKALNGVTTLEALLGGGGLRLGSSLDKLKKKGHTFRDEWETSADGSRIKRHWWTGFEAPQAQEAGNAGE